MQMMDVDKLVPHEKNSYFFDDMSGEAWMAFLESIETSGIIEPIVITESSHVIISGHQRVRAAKHFKMKQVPVTFREDKGEDEILKQLIETNIRQRGIGNTNPIKFGRCLKELDRIYGVRNGSAGGNGSNQYTKQLQVQNAPQAKTQKDIATEIGISVDQYKRYEALTNLIPEIADMVDNGLTMTSAVAIARKLSPEEQRQLAEQISGREKISNKDVSQYVEQIKVASEENERLRKIVSEKEAENVRLKNQKQEVREVIKKVEVPPSDYDLIQKERKQFLSERNKANARIKELEEREGIHDMQMKLERESEYLETQISTFIRTVGGYVWITEKIEDLPEDKRMDVIKAIKNINAWSQQMLTNIGGNIA